MSPTNREDRSLRRVFADEEPVKQMVSVCAWHADAEEQTRSARAHGFDVSHSICPTCETKFESGSQA